MALHLNLLHEEILEQRQRQRDPLKIGMLVLASIGALLFLYYMWNGYRTLEIKRRLSATQSEWRKVEPNLKAAEQKSAELNGIINATRVLEEMIEKRFFWAPFLDHIAHCVAPNAQLTAMDGNVDDTHVVHVSLEGVAAGREPRAAAEDLRQLLIEQLGKSYADVKVEFKTLEDLDTIVNIGGEKMPMARYILSVTLQSLSATPEKKPSPAPVGKAKR